MKEGVGLPNFDRMQTVSGRLHLVNRGHGAKKVPHRDSKKPRGLSLTHYRRFGSRILGFDELNSYRGSRLRGREDSQSCNGRAMPMPLSSTSAKSCSRVCCCSTLRVPLPPHTQFPLAAAMRRTSRHGALFSEGRGWSIYDSRPLFQRDPFFSDRPRFPGPFDPLKCSHAMQPATETQLSQPRMRIQCGRPPSC